MSEDNDFDYSALHDDCVPADDALSYVLENSWDEVEEAVRDSRGQQWLYRSRPYIDLLSVVSQRDREHIRGEITKQADDPPSAEQVFAIAADVSAFLEQLPKAYPFPQVIFQSRAAGYHGSHPPTAVSCMALSAQSCSLDDDLSWANDLLIVARAFRDILFVVSDSDVPDGILQLQISKPIRVVNAYLHRSPAQPLSFWQGEDKHISFGRFPDPETPDLSSFVATWISDYLENYYSHVGLGVCAECGKFFDRERRDKTFCSKTCQNRVAYKRKKILESNALAPISIAPDRPYDISVGLWAHHPRYGIGRVESVNNEGTEMESLLKNLPTKPDDAARYRSMLARKIRVQIRFSHGVRTFGYGDLFEGQKKEDQVPTFYELKSEETLATLL
jgi:hypothetical protein